MATKRKAGGLDNKLIGSLADRLQKLVDDHRSDIDTLKADADVQGVDFAGIRRLVSWRRQDPVKRAEREAIDEQYRYLAGERALPAAVPAGGELSQAVDLYRAGKSVRDVAAAMKVSTGKAQKLRSLALLFTVHGEMNVNTPPHDPETGEITKSSGGVEGHASPAASRCQEGGSPPSADGNSERADLAKPAAGVEPGPLDTPPTVTGMVIGNVELVFAKPAEMGNPMTGADVGMPRSESLPEEDPLEIPPFLRRVPA